MGKNPYSDLPKSAFWKTGVAQENPYAIEGIYKKKFDISANAKIATAGSCFAQHVSRHLKKNGYNVLDVEPPPPALPDNLHQKFGFSMYSARYGNIYTVRQLLQLAQEVAGEWTPQNYIWEKNEKFYDALRPAVEPEGLGSPEEVAEHRQYHVSRVKDLFESLDLFIFTLGLTEMWVHKESGTVYPTAPGTLVGEFRQNLYQFKNAQYNDIINDFDLFQKVVEKIRSGKSFKCLLTVSPVPLTATASGDHVLNSTVYSKSTLRSVAGQLSANHAHIDYFPSYEIVTNPRLKVSGFENNLRSVKSQTVEIVMRHFSNAHFQDRGDVPKNDNNSLSNSEIVCEEGVLEEFSLNTQTPSNESQSEVHSIDFSVCDVRSLSVGIHDILLKNIVEESQGCSLDFRFENFAHPNAPLVVYLHGAIDRKKHMIPFFEHSIVTRSINKCANIMSISDPVLRKKGVQGLGWYCHSELNSIDLICKAIDLISGQLSSSSIIILGHSGSGLAATQVARKLLYANLMLWNPTFDVLRYYKGDNYNNWLTSMGIDPRSKTLRNDLKGLDVRYSVIDQDGFKSVRGRTVILQETADNFHIKNQLLPMLLSAGFDDVCRECVEGSAFSGLVDSEVYLHFGSWRRTGRNDPSHMTPPKKLVDYLLAALIYSNSSALCKNQLSEFNLSRHSVDV